MRRPHRRAHVLIWLAIIPVVVAGLVVAIDAKPKDAQSPLPASLAGEKR